MFSLKMPFGLLASSCAIFEFGFALQTLQSLQQMICSILLNAFNTSALEDPSAACLKFEEMHDGVKAQKEKCTKPPSKKVSVFY